MKSVTTEKFRKMLVRLPRGTQKRARQAYQLWKQDHHHTSLQFKQVHQTQPIYSVRVGSSYRALGVIQDETIVWFWVGSHERYNNQIKQL
ncbi:type II toxin-antitoxin system RelE family toxin [Tunicatimonas pelagia]|uniref:type II toxin-antitoxin system RelE family toxin n=1 Tax=Tunicatimonas pelagia TaxID=931531 RepID=UPI00266700BB|nr:hypothetical protein [Tunicatimonas pelagia]WKN41804.1 hypothetical protein P0M28_22455 [Tunicatimonas pelagia]